MSEPKAAVGSLLGRRPAMRRPRWVNRLYANLLGYFWLPCPICGQMFGGHERSKTVSVPVGPDASLIVCWRHAPRVSPLSAFGTNALIQELIERGDLGLAVRVYNRHRPLRWWKRRDGWPLSSIAPGPESERSA